MLEVNRRLGELEKEAAMQRLQRERDDLKWSIENLRRDQTREWDLNDPAALQKMKVTRKDEIDENGNYIINKELGPSSGQVFDGEDLYANRRIKKQMQQFDEEMQADQKLRQERLAKERQEELDY